MSLDYSCMSRVYVYCARRIPAHLRCTQCSVMLNIIDICFLPYICLWQISQIQTCLRVIVRPGILSTSPVFMRNSASHSAGPHDRLSKKNTENRASNAGDWWYHHCVVWSLISFLSLCLVRLTPLLSLLIPFSNLPLIFLMYLIHLAFLYHPSLYSLSHSPISMLSPLTPLLSRSYTSYLSHPSPLSPLLFLLRSLSYLSHAPLLPLSLPLSSPKYQKAH